MTAPPCREELAITSLAEHPTADRAAVPSVRARPILGLEPSRIERWAVTGLLLWLLVGPRIELPISSVRVEDLVFVVLALICLLHVRPLGRPSGVTLAVLGVVATGIVSSLVAGARGTLDPVTAVLFAVRPVEYWIAFPATLLVLRGAPALWTRRLDVVLAVTTLLQAAFAVLQYYFGIPIGFSHAAYTRAAGLTVGPYELGAISAALVVYWVVRGRWVLASVSVIALAASISRISMLAAAVALAILLVAWLVRQVRAIRRRGVREAFMPYTRSRARLAVSVLAVGTAGLVLAFTLGLLRGPDLGSPGQDTAGPAPVAEPSEAAASDTPTPTPTVSATASATSAPTSDLPAPPSESISTRIASTSVLGSWEVAAGLAAEVSPPQTSGQYADIAYSHINDFLNAGSALSPGAEPSNLVRFFRWNLILNTVSDPVEFVFGLGPSFVGPSVDGSYLRFFADGGILGVLAWLALIVMWLRRSPFWMVCVTISLLVGALFIDIVYAERPMVLYWLLLAMATAGGAAARARRASGQDVAEHDDVVRS